MTFKQYLKEEFYNSFKHSLGTMTDVYKNPTRGEISELRKSLSQVYTTPLRFGLTAKPSRYDIRGLIVGKDLYIWGGDDLHETMSKKLNYFGAQVVPLYLDPINNSVELSTIMMTGHGFTSLSWYEDQDYIVDLIKKCKPLKAVMGNYQLSTV